MAFPTNPTNGQQATVNNILYYYNSSKSAWIRYSVGTLSNALANSSISVTSIESDNVTVSGTFSQGTSSYVANHYVLHGETTDATETEIFVNNQSGNRIPVATDSTMAYSVDVVARRTDATGESGNWHLKGTADNFSGTVADVGDVYEVVISADDTNLEVDARADDSNNSVNIYVVGVAGKTYRWVAKVTTIEVIE